MFTRLEPLENAKHRELRFAKSADFGFSRNTPVVRLSFSEILQAGRYFPVVFPAEGACMPMALLSPGQGKNRYVDAQGRWQAPYVPFSIRMYPFTLVPVEEASDKFALCLDPDAPHFASGQGEPMFTADGEPNTFVQDIMKALTAYQKELAATRVRFAELAENQIITDQKIEVPVNGQPRSVDGFKGVDMEKLLAMDDTAIADLVRNGTLPLIYSHLQSFSNFASLFEQGN